MNDGTENILHLAATGFTIQFSSGGFNMIKITLIKIEEEELYKTEQIVPTDHHFTDGDRLEGLLDFMKSEIFKMIKEK